MLRLITCVLVMLISLPGISGGGKKSFSLNTGKSNIQWTGRKVTGEHTGNVSFKSGQIIVENNQVVAVQAVVDMNSITCSDIQNAEYNQKLVNHLKSDDFFSVARYGTSVFVLTAMVPVPGAKAGEANYLVNGKMTIKGITNEVQFPARIDISEKTLTVAADVVFDRTKFDIKYKSASFFEGIADKAIHDEVKFSLAIVASLDN